MAERTLTGIVKPEVDNRALDRQSSKIQESFGDALRVAGEELESMVPGGRAIRKLRKRLGGGSRGAGGAGQNRSLTGSSIQTAQLEKLDDIHDELKKMGASDAGDGDGGGGILPTSPASAAIGGVTGLGALAVGGVYGASTLGNKMFGRNSNQTVLDRATMKPGTSFPEQSFQNIATGLLFGKKGGSGGLINEKKLQKKLNNLELPDLSGLKWPKFPEPPGWLQGLLGPGGASGGSRRGFSKTELERAQGTYSPGGTAIKRQELNANTKAKKRQLERAQGAFSPGGAAIKRQELNQARQKKATSLGLDLGELDINLQNLERQLESAVDDAVPGRSLESYIQQQVEDYLQDTITGGL